jgi:hypothetical protein
MTKIQTEYQVSVSVENYYCTKPHCHCYGNQRFVIHCIDSGPSLDHVLRCLSPVHTFTTYFLKIYFHTKFPLANRRQSNNHFLSDQIWIYVPKAPTKRLHYHLEITIRNSAYHKNSVSCMHDYHLELLTSTIKII